MSGKKYKKTKLPKRKYVNKKGEKYVKHGDKKIVINVNVSHSQAAKTRTSTRPARIGRTRSQIQKQPQQIQDLAMQTYMLERERERMKKEQEKAIQMTPSIEQELVNIERKLVKHAGNPEKTQVYQKMKENLTDLLKKLSEYRKANLEDLNVVRQYQSEAGQAQRQQVQDASQQLRNVQGDISVSQDISQQNVPQQDIQILPHEGVPVINEGPEIQREEAKERIKELKEQRKALEESDVILSKILSEQYLQKKKTPENILDVTYEKLQRPVKKQTQLMETARSLQEKLEAIKKSNQTSAQTSAQTSRKASMEEQKNKFEELLQDFSEIPFDAPQELLDSKQKQLEQALQNHQISQDQIKILQQKIQESQEEIKQGEEKIQQQSKYIQALDKQKQELVKQKQERDKKENERKQKLIEKLTSGQLQASTMEQAGLLAAQAKSPHDIEIEKRQKLPEKLKEYDETNELINDQVIKIIKEKNRLDTIQKLKAADSVSLGALFSGLQTLEHSRRQLKQEILDAGGKKEDYEDKEFDEEIIKKWKDKLSGSDSYVINNKDKKEMIQRVIKQFGKGEDEEQSDSDDGAMTIRQLLQLIFLGIEDIDEYDVIVIDNYNKKAHPTKDKQIFIFFSKIQGSDCYHFTVGVHEDHEFAYFDPLSNEERIKKDSEWIKKNAHRISPQTMFKLKVNINHPWQNCGMIEDKEQENWCAEYNFVFLHNYINLGESYKEATEFVDREDKEELMKAVQFSYI